MFHVHFHIQETDSQACIHMNCDLCVCVCILILVTTFPDWLSGTEPLPHTPGAVHQSSLCLLCFAST